jgi:hypothetical protein
LLIKVGLLLLAAALILMLCGVILLAQITDLWPMQESGVGDAPVAQAAALLAAHLTGPRAQDYGSDFPEAVIHYWEQVCPSVPLSPAQGCYLNWQSGNLQCVLFVTGAYALAGQPLPVAGNAVDFWTLYQHQAGWRELPVAGVSTSARSLPLPGDMLVWADDPAFVPEAFGHVAIVLSVTPPVAGRDGSVTFAEANGPGALVTQALSPDRSLRTWPHYTLLGYLRSPLAFTPGHPFPTGTLVRRQYQTLAQADAQAVGIDPALFVRQIEVESGFNPAARSSAGAIGIAQLLPGTAAQLGVNPTDPVASLEAAARYMASLLARYGGDEAKALAAYNAGPGAVDAAIRQAGAQWRLALPVETQHSLQRILGGTT